MELIPKNYEQDLDLIILFANIGSLFSHICNRRPQAKRYILICGIKSNIDAKYYMLFDEVIVYDYNQRIEVLADIVGRYVSDSKRTRFITNSDSSQLIGVQMRKIFGIPGRSEEVINSFLDKDVCKKILRQGKVRLPNYYCPSLENCQKDLQNEIEQLEQKIRYPMYAKPTLMFAGIGNFKIENQEQLKNAITYYVNNNIQFEVDEFLHGTLLEVDCIIFNNDIVFFVAWQNVSDFIKMYDGKTMGQIMLPSDTILYKRLFKYTQDVIKAYKDIPNDVLDIEVWLTPNDELVLQELQLRRPGNKVSIAIQETIGLSVELVSQELQTNNSIRVPKDDFKTRWKQYGAWVEINLRGPLKIKSCNAIPTEIKSKVKYQWKHNKGFELKKDEYYLESVDIILVNEDYEQLQKDWKILCEWKAYNFY